MNALVKKEIRLLLPSWMAVLLLEVLQPWVWREPDGIFFCLPVILFFGIIILAVESFGREFSLGTFQSLLSQPVERRKIWRTKITVLFFAAGLIFAAYFASCELRIHQGLRSPLWHVHPTIIQSDFRNAMFVSGAALFIALTGGLWTALLLRQIAAAFWITFLTPAGILVAISLCLPSKLTNNEHVVISLLYSAAGLYIASGFGLAHCLFRRAQDVAWTGGVINFSSWRYFEAGSKPSVASRRRRPIAALFRKEFQLHSMSLFCACALLALHIGIFFLRIFYANYHKNSLADGLSDFFWVLWLVMPLTIGCMAVAEERKLGVAEEQSCLPVSRRVQFAIKFIPAIIFGTLLGGVMPLFLETVAAHLGAPSEFFKPENHAHNPFISDIISFKITIVALAAGLALASFFASTLARNFLQALSITIVIIVGCGLFASFISHIGQQLVSGFRTTPWPWALSILISIPTIVVMYLWLACRNFSHFHETGRLWRGNIFGIIGALLFVFVSSAAIYNRPWEIFERAEPPHGPAKFSLANPPRLNSEYGNLLVRLPDGRVWFNGLKYPYEEQPSRWKGLWLMLGHTLPKSAGPQQFIAGSNWVSATAWHVDWWDVRGTPSRAIHLVGYLDTVGVKSNGTLWISSESKPKMWNGGEMIQFGDKTNWQQIARSHGGRFGIFLLLKNDGTLWCWGTNRYNWDDLQTNWPTARRSMPQQIGTNSDWQAAFYNAWKGLVRKTDGSVWSVGLKNGKDEFERQTDLDQVVFQTFSYMSDARMAYVGKDGTLWVCNRQSNGNNSWTGTGFLQVGKETNWLAVTVTWHCLVALKSDGSLWKWNFFRDSTAKIAKSPPTRLGIHNDWVGLTGIWGGVVSLAADGSLWLWPTDDYGIMLLKAPKQPQFLGNVFGKSD